MQDFKLFLEEKKVQLSSEFYSKIKYLTQGTIYSNEKYIPGQDMKLWLFDSMIGEIVRKCFLDIEFMPDMNNEIKYDISLMQELAQRFKEVFRKVARYNLWIYVKFLDTKI